MARRKIVLCAFLPSEGVRKLTKLLKEAGFAVVAAQSFHSALQWLYTDRPDAILLDQNFSIVDGLWSADIIKRILPNAVMMLVDPDDSNLPAVVQSLSDRLRNRQVNGAGASGS